MKGGGVCEKPRRVGLGCWGGGAPALDDAATGRNITGGGIDSMNIAHMRPGTSCPGVFAALSYHKKESSKI